MSALAKPLTKFSTSTTPNAVVGVEHLASVDKLDTSAIPNQPAGTARFNLLFTYQYPDGQTKKVTIPFLLDATRNTALATFHTNNTVTI